jgi:hypothetical protein
MKNDIVEIEFEELIIDSRFSQNVYLVVGLKEEILNE